MDAYPHLHVHSCYTLLGATPAPDELARQAAADGLTHLALTDTNALYGAVAFDRACRSAGVQPLLGLTVTVAWPDDLGAPPPPRTTPGLLVLLARNADGYRSLSALSSQIQTDPDREARALQGVPLHALRAHREGLICLTGGRCGYAWRSLAAGMDEAGWRRAKRLGFTLKEIIDNAHPRNFVGGFLEAATRDDIEFVPILVVRFIHGGLIEADVYDHYAGRIVDGLREAGNIDGVFFTLHGAMAAADPYTDAEGELRAHRHEGDDTHIQRNA